MFKKFMLFFILVFIFAVNSGCAVRPTAEEMATWDYGPYPDNYEEILKDNMYKYLVDPSSAQFRFIGSPQHFYWTSFEGVKYGWGGYVYVNAKNRMGGYAGATKFGYVIRNGQLIEFKRAYDN